MSDFVSVVMPAYNAESTLRLAIGSVLAQSHSNIELIIADDCSTDATGHIADSFNDSRLRVVHLSQNLGEGGARDSAIEAATGDWIAVIDADDAWVPDRLEKMLALEPEISGRSIIVDNLMQCYERSGELVPWRPLWTADFPLMSGQNLELKDYLAMPRHIIKPLVPRSVITEFMLRHTDIKMGADTQFFIRAIKKGSLKIKVCREAGYLYRLTPGSLSAHPQRYQLLKNMFLNLTETLEFSAGELEAIRHKLLALDAQIEYMPFLSKLKEKQYREALRLGYEKPALFLEFLKRIPDTLPYRLHVLLHRGQSR